ncbi:LysR family transcriptional regulator [Roseateles sp.]|uniref:LysR family transcriptional regulator n=1 Tax=Roseateles sp. TaxID=1971397 RepID=UPI003BA5C411
MDLSLLMHESKKNSENGEHYSIHAIKGRALDLLRDMALFVEVVRKRSFTAAAAALDMPASTLSRRISTLERSLGLSLLSRTTRRVEMTESGAAYYARCVPLVEAAQVAHEQIRQGSEWATGTLRLSCSPDFAAFYLPEVLEAYTRQHEGLSVELDLTPRVVDLYSEALDAAVRIGRLSDSSLVARRLGALGRGLYASPDYLAMAGQPRSPEELAQHMGVALKAGEANKRWRLRPVSASAPRPGSSVEVEVRSRFAAGSVTMVQALVLRGAGIGVLDHLMSREALRRGQLVRVLPEWAVPDAEIYLLTVSRFVPARVRLFGDLLQARLESANQA